MASPSRTLSHEEQMEELSFAYLRAVCAKIGASVERHGKDADGIDGSVKKIVWIDPEGQGAYRFDVSFEFQLKSTSQGLKEDDEFLYYPLKIKNYRDLIGKASVRRFLLLFVLPSDFENSVVHTLDSLAICRCMYWLEFSNFEDSDNSSSITVKIPKKNAASPEGLDALLNRIAEEC